MRPVKTVLLVLAGVTVIAGAATARSTESMLDECAGVGKSYYKDFGVRTEMKYNGQRVDGTHAVNGQIFLENHAPHFACSFDRSGRKMTEFFADGKQRNAYLPGRGGHGGGSDDSGYSRVTGVPRDDILNVRRGPSAHSDIVGALGNGERVRNLGCRTEGGSRWCRIQMLDEMRSEGWVNAHYLNEIERPSGSSAKIDHGGYIRTNCAEAVARKVGVSPNDVVVTNSTISEGTGRHMVYVGVPNGKADWICEADNDARVVNVFYGGEG